MYARDIIDFVSEFDSAQVLIPVGLDPGQLAIHRVVRDEDAKPGDLAWLSARKVALEPGRVAAFRGSALICPSSAAPATAANAVVIYTDAPKTLIALVIQHFFPTLTNTRWPEAFSAISPDARIGSAVRLAPGVVIGERVEIGDGVEIGPNTCLANTTVGENVRIGCNCSIGLAGFGYARGDDEAWSRFPHVGGVRIEADVEIGSNSCIDRGSIGDTIIRRGAKIDNLVHVAHNCDIGEDALLIANCMIGGSVVIGARAWVAPSSAINNQLSVGTGAIIGTAAVVIRNVEPGTTVVGNPAKPLTKKPNS